MATSQIGSIPRLVSIIVDTVVYVEWLEKAVERKLADKSIGLPVALRAQVNLSSDHGLLVPSLAGLAAAAERWFRSTPLTVYAQGGAELEYVSLLVKFSGGQTAVTSSEVVRGDGGSGAEGPNVLLLVVGNHGTMQFTDHPSRDGRAVDIEPPGGAEARKLARAIEESLSRGQPVSPG